MIGKNKESACRLHLCFPFDIVFEVSVFLIRFLSLLSADHIEGQREKGIYIFQKAF